MAQGSLVVVGLGIKLAQQCTPEARAEIEAASLVFAAVDPVQLSWLQQLNANVVSLHEHYERGRARTETYEQMSDRIMAAVRDGQRVCAAFYGHPGVFVRPSYMAIDAARLEGFAARMLPGISAADCLCADLLVDPANGWQAYEAQHFYLSGRVPDPSCALILWQIAVFGDLSTARFEPCPQGMGLLAEFLIETYGPAHEVTIYEAATLPLRTPTMARVSLSDLALARVTQSSTLYVPPIRARGVAAERLKALKRLDPER